MALVIVVNIARVSMLSAQFTMTTIITAAIPCARYSSLLAAETIWAPTGWSRGLVKHTKKAFLCVFHVGCMHCLSRHLLDCKVVNKLMTGGACNDLVQIERSLKHGARW
jgi:hypothetical protein